MQVIPESGVHLEFIFLSYITLVDGIKVRKTLEGNVDFEKFEIGKRTKSGNDILSLTSMCKDQWSVLWWHKQIEQGLTFIIIFNVIHKADEVMRLEMMILSTNIVSKYFEEIEGLWFYISVLGISNYFFPFENKSD